MVNDIRAKYWNEDYYNYWQKRVEESANNPTQPSALVRNDHAVPSDMVYEDLFDMFDINNGSLLDVGCAWGRMFPMYASRNIKIHGVDISEKMVAEANKKAQQFQSEVEVSTAENLPFKPEYFDYVVCLGVFDATYQHQALSEFLRVVKTGGNIIISGKNNKYLSDDTEAALAEVGARKKGEPNYFTDVKYLTQQLESIGHRVQKCLYFERRGDFAAALFDEAMPERFYEFCLIIEKKNSNYRLEPFSHEFSC
jgi:ubiquinone/menaquinone biosynthesis C-methylase UbiE